MSYISALMFHCSPEEATIVDLAMQVIDTLALASGAHNDAKAKGLHNDSMEIGCAMSCGELPLAQAVVLYAIRDGIMHRLTEAGQRQLAEKCISLLASIVGETIPVAVGTLSGASSNFSRCVPIGFDSSCHSFHGRIKYGYHLHTYLPQ